MSNKTFFSLIISVAGILALAFLGLSSFKTIPVGHVGVATLFGKAQLKTHPEGLHFPVNPLLTWTIYDVRQKTHFESVSVPSQDQMQTKVDISVQYRLIASDTYKILQDTGTFDEAINVHLIPKLRSIAREQGKRVEKAEYFFKEEVQQLLQASMLTDLVEFLQPNGIEVSDVLIREITLPKFIGAAIEKKKQREQLAEEQKAELDRFKTEQLQKVAAAEAEKNAAEQEALKRRMLAEASAYEIETVNRALSDSPNYLQLQALETLKAMSKNPATQIYFMDSDSPNPLPLMHMGKMFTPKSPAP